MPYIKKGDRVIIDNILLNQLDMLTLDEGQMNYVITKLCRKYIDDHGGESYKNYNALIGLMECAKLELYRRKVSIYEDVKITENGDV